MTIDYKQIYITLGKILVATEARDISLFDKLDDKFSRLYKSAYADENLVTMGTTHNYHELDNIRQTCLIALKFNKPEPECEQLVNSARKSFSELKKP
ncbi:MAG: hypothetical protein ABH828_00360 [archaeon]